MQANAQGELQARLLEGRQGIQSLGRRVHKIALSLEVFVRVKNSARWGCKCQFALACFEENSEQLCHPLIDIRFKGRIDICPCCGYAYAILVKLE